MNNSTNPAEAIRQTALSFPETTTDDSCNQTAFKVAKGTFLFIGPGAKGVGFKAMFKLRESMSEAIKLADKEPKRFEVGKTGWVTTRFTQEAPLAESIWRKWLVESYEVTRGTKL